jgi:lysophospholipase L1-like esterase
MKNPKKWPIFLIALNLAVAGLSARKESVFLESFEFQGQTYSLYADFSPPKAGLSLKGKTGRNLSAGLAGESILLGTRVGKDNFYIFWLYARKESLHLAYYDHRLDRSRVLPLSGFHFFGLPEIIEANGGLQGLVFLGNRSDNDDLYHFDAGTGALTPLTRTPFSEKVFTLKAAADGVEIGTRSLWKTFRYRFDPRSRHCQLIEERAFPGLPRRAAAAIDPSTYYNTYIGFGDSITHGQWEGLLWPDQCFLAKMGEILAPSYGPTYLINLGIGGTMSYEGAERVEAALDENPAFYFLLFYGVNDVIHKEIFSLESSLENLEFMIDAALARNMRVIISTLTPRKDVFATYKFYWQNLRALSNGIVELATRKNIPWIDTFNTFMNYNPPDGWKSLLESVNPPIAKGNHPNEHGHEIIANLFAPVLAAFPPQAPQNIAVLDPQDPLQRTVSWEANYESDFSHYQIDFGFLPDTFDYSFATAANSHTFALFPFLPQLYFRMRTIDRGGKMSDFVSTNAAGAASALPAKKSE